MTHWWAGFPTAHPGPERGQQPGSCRRSRSWRPMPIDWWRSVIAWSSRGHPEWHWNLSIQPWLRASRHRIHPIGSQPDPLPDRNWPEYGWSAHEPVALPTWDLLVEKVRQETREYLARVDPDLLAIAWPCTPWSQMQRINRRAPWQCRELERKRAEGRILLIFVEELVHLRLARRRAVIGENPFQSLAWQEPPIKSAFAKCATGKCHVCFRQKETRYSSFGSENHSNRWDS
jgi:hypothetical protein